MERATDCVRFWLNDQMIEERGLLPTTTLLRYLRDHRSSTGTKEGCAEGDCGACTVAILEERQGEEPTFRAVNSCLLFLPMLQGKRVYTVEALRSGSALSENAAAGYHPAQQAMVQTRGSQCGYCTPGIVMALFEATYRSDISEPWQLDDQLCGNLCRCTGYRPIRDAAKHVAGTRPNDRFLAEQRQYSPGDAGIDLKVVDPLHGGQHYLQPTSLADLYETLDAHPKAKIVSGGTDLGLSVTKRHEHFPEVIGLDGVAELRELRRTETHWEVGAAVNLTRVMETVGEEVDALKKLLRVFGSRQIRSRATFGGNLVNASPIGDTPPVLAAMDAVLVLGSSAGERRVPVDSFFTGYRQTVLKEGEIVLRVDLPHAPAGSFLGAYKVSKRRELDISTVAAGCRVTVEDGVVADIRLFYGGVAAAAAARAKATEAVLLGGPWTEEAIEAAFPTLDAEFAPLSDLRGSADYRNLLIRNLLLGFFVESTSSEPTFEAEPVGAARIVGGQA